MFDEINDIKDFIFKHDHHVTFWFDLNQEPIMIHFLSGDISLLGFSKTNTMSLEKLISHIEPNNTLAEIEGKETFIEDFFIHIKQIKDETHVYLPLKYFDKTLWCSIGFEVMRDRVVFGRVNRINDSLPKAIEYYQKAFQDPLTKLFTRETLRMHLSYVCEYEGKYGLYIDIDNFKWVNDNFGHSIGDGLLKAIAQSFIDCWEHHVIYYRLGGDEFFVYVMDHSKEEVIQRAKQLIKQIENISYLGRTYEISASIGIVPITEGTVDYMTLLDIGDKVMYQSKARGKGQFTLYQTSSK